MFKDFALFFFKIDKFVVMLKLPNGPGVESVPHRHRNEKHNGGDDTKGLKEAKGIILEGRVFNFSGKLERLEATGVK